MPSHIIIYHYLDGKNILVQQEWYSCNIFIYLFIYFLHFLPFIPPSTLWWSVNLSDNWPFNVWSVNLIKTLTTINTQVNCNMVCLSGEVCVLWLAEAFTANHTPGDTANHRHFTPSYLICRPYMCFSARQDMLANQNLHVYNMQIMSNCWRAS